MQNHCVTLLDGQYTLTDHWVTCAGLTDHRSELCSAWRRRSLIAFKSIECKWRQHKHNTKKTVGKHIVNKHRCSTIPSISQQMSRVSVSCPLFVIFFFSGSRCSAATGQEWPQLYQVHQTASHDALVCCGINLHISLKPWSECVNVKPLTHSDRAFFPSTLTSLPDAWCMLVALCIGTAVSSLQMTQTQTQTTASHVINANPKRWRRPRTTALLFSD